MKKRIRLMLSLVLALTMVMGLSVNSFAISGAGTVSDPYLISSMQAGDNLGSNFYVTNDLDYTVYCYGDNTGLMYVTKYFFTYEDTAPDSTCTRRWLELAPGDNSNDSFPIIVAGVSLKPITPPASSVGCAHVHNFQWQTITEPTKDSDGLEGEVCSCGATRNTQPISAYACSMEQYAYPKVTKTAAGNTCVLEMGTMDSYPKRFMEAIAPSVLRGVTVELRFKSNQKLTKIQIPGGSVVDTSFDWYGVEKLKELYTLIP